jgi:hypothetical protein
MAGLHESLALLALDPGKGRLRGASAAGGFAFAAACLQELDLRGRVAVEDGRLAVRDAKPTGDAALDAVLGAVAGSRPRRVEAWLTRSRRLRLRGLVLHALARRGAAARLGEKVWLFTRVRYRPAAAARTEALRALDAGGPLLELATAAGLLRRVRPGLGWRATRAARAAARRNPYARALLNVQASAGSAGAVAAMVAAQG